KAYEDFVKEHYTNNRSKKNKLLMDDIPDGFIERQLNDSRYISKVVKGLLSNIVREKLANGEYEQEAVSKNLISCNGTITDYLKKDWGINDVWNRIILPRFERMNKITGKDCFTTTTTEGHLIPNMPFELSKGFNKKRIDHRHHAMDAIVIACTTRDHVNLLNNEAAHSKYDLKHNANRYQLQRKLRRFEKEIINGKEKEIAKEFLKPWESFTTDVQKSLENIIVSFKQNLRVINKTTNHSEHYEDGKKILVKQEKGDSWAIRKSMHKDTVFGEVNLRKIKAVSLNEALKKPTNIVNKDFKQKIRELLAEGKDAKSIKKYLEENKDNPAKIEVYYFTKETKERYFATRKNLDTSFDKKTIEESIADSGIQKILLAHLEAKGGNPELAFSPDGIDEMNRNIIALNNGKFHQPIIKVRKYEKAEKFAVGQNGNKSKKFVEAAKGTNLFFAIFVSEKENKDTGEIEKIRSYLTIPLNTMIDCQKEYGKKWKDNIEKFLKDKDLVDQNVKLLFILSPNDLVYLPTTEDLKNGIMVVEKKRIYKMVSSSGNQCFFVSEKVAKSIVDKLEFSTLNKTERATTGEMIKETCVPIKVDRLGNIIEINGKPIK
ncbi:MAG: type II CRISPR RNA-guided endonuclease Cas9, partial [Bacteroidales bacterium]|nr:type II CRISPR RNA-guided endonuclease Cas9 [Bacteroidales bacterium]